ncbi:hypothetical protein ACOMHN_039391 [Nucella lapillus]
MAAKLVAEECGHLDHMTHMSLNKDHDQLLCMWSMRGTSLQQVQILHKADERNDEWGESVKLRVHCLGDLIAAEAVYHHDCQTSDQHNDLRACSTKQDAKDYGIFLNWLQLHSPFSYTAEDTLVSISTGILADKSANADQAYTIGKSAAEEMTGRQYGDVKLKRKDRIKSIAAKESVSVRGQEVEVNSTLLFMRVTCVINHQEEMEQYLRHEFGSKPPALFNKGIMRKNTKSVLANVLKSKVTPVAAGLQNPYYIIDGGHLLHSVKWPAGSTYDQVCDEYVAHVLNSYGKVSTVIFDGYDIMSTKVAEQQRRAIKNVSPDILFELDMSVTTHQNLFLANRRNKARLITKLMPKLESSDVTCSQSPADADYLISNTALTSANLLDRPVVLVGTDTDLLVMLVDKADPTMDVYMQFTNHPPTIYSIHEIQETLHAVVKKYILFAHAATGCDTVSAMYNIGKRKALSVLQNNRIDWDILDVFGQQNPTTDEIARVGETFLLQLYGATNCISLDKYRKKLEKIFEERNVTAGEQARLAEVWKLSKGCYTAKSDRKDRILLRLLGTTSGKTMLLINLYRGVLPKFQNYLKLYQSDKPMLHTLHVDMYRLTRDFLCLFLKSDVMPKSFRVSDLMKIDSTDPSNQVSDRNLTVGCHAYHKYHSLQKCSNKPHWFHLFLQQLRSGYQNACVHLQTKLPLDNTTLSNLSALDPEMHGSEKTVEGLRALADKLPNVICAEETGTLYEEVRMYNSCEVISSYLPLYLEQGKCIDQHWWHCVLQLKTEGKTSHLKVNQHVEAEVPSRDGKKTERFIGKRAIASEITPPKHEDNIGTSLNIGVFRAIVPVYKKLADPELLKRCTHSKTQNANESLHGVIWSRCPKDNFASRAKVEMATILAVGEFNMGSTASHNFMASQGLTVGRHTKRLGKARDNIRQGNS